MMTFLILTFFSLLILVIASVISPQPAEVDEEQISRLIRAQFEKGTSAPFLIDLFETTEGERSLRESSRRAIEGFSPNRRQTLLDQLQNGNSRGALREFEAQYRSDQSKADQAQRQADESLLAVASLALVAGEVHKAQDYLDRLISSQPTNAVALIMMGRLKAFLGEYERAEALFKRVLEHHLEESTEALAYANLGSVFWLQGKLDESLDASMKAFEIHERLGMRRETCEDLIDLAKIYRVQGHIEDARSSLHKALSYNPAKNGLQRNKILSELGVVERIAGNLGEAETHLKNAFRIAEQLESKPAQATDLSHLSEVFLLQGDLDRALAFCERALELDRETGWSAGQAHDYDILGQIFRMKQEYELAEQAHRKSLRIDERIRRQKGIAISYHHLGVVCLETGDFEEAEKHLCASLKINEDLDRLEGIAENRHYLGRLAIQRGAERSLVMLHLEKSQQCYEEIGNNKMANQVAVLIKSLSENPSG